MAEALWRTARFLGGRDPHREKHHTQVTSVAELLTTHQPSLLVRARRRAIIQREMREAIASTPNYVIILNNMIDVPVWRLFFRCMGHFKVGLNILFTRMIDVFVHSLTFAANRRSRLSEGKLERGEPHAFSEPRSSIFCKIPPRVGGW